MQHATPSSLGKLIYINDLIHGLAARLGQSAASLGRSDLRDVVHARALIAVARIVASGTERTNRAGLAMSVPWGMGGVHPS